MIREKTIFIAIFIPNSQQRIIFAEVQRRLAISLRFLFKVAFPNIYMDDDPRRSIFILCNLVTFFSRTRKTYPSDCITFANTNLHHFYKFLSFIQYVLYVLDGRWGGGGASQQCSFEKIIIYIFLLYCDVYKQHFIRKIYSYLSSAIICRQLQAIHDVGGNNLQTC
jgi:hypothetical protein